MSDPSTGREAVASEVDTAILEFLDGREATYLAVMAQELAFPVSLIRDRCHALAEEGALDRESHTYYAITDAGRQEVGSTTDGGANS